MPWLTPNDSDEMGAVILTVPMPFIRHVLGCLVEMTNVENWEQFGELTPEQAADIMITALDEVDTHGSE